MLKTLLIICCLFYGSQSHPSEGYFTIVAPGSIRSNSEYHVSLSVDDFTHACWFNITLVTSTSTYGFSKVISGVTVEVQPRTTKLVKIQLPKLYYGHGLLRVFGYRGIIYEEEGRISIEGRNYMPYIQTNKGKYKPGEMVQFRVIFIDRLTRPAEVEEAIDVYIYDGQKNLIRKFSNSKLEQGVFKGQLQLSEYPVLGEWTIEVRVDDVTLVKELFEVDRYVLPKFSVEIDTKKNVAFVDNEMVIKVKSSYSYDQPVKGKLTINLVYAPTKYSTVNVTKEFNGETAINLDFETDLKIGKYFCQPSSSKSYLYAIKATVTEALTGEFHDATAEVRIHCQPYNIQIEAPANFDADDSVNITVSVTDLQENPIKDTKNPISITVKSIANDVPQLIEMPVEVTRTIFLNENGVGVVTLNLPNVEIHSEYEATAHYIGYSSHQTTLNKNTLECLNLDVLTERPEVGRDMLIMLKSNDPIDYFIYEIISRGDIIQSKRINVPDKNNQYLLKISTTYSMVPKITLFVHCVQDGIIKSILKEVFIKRAFQNSINITTEDEVLPGSLVSLNVITDEGSYVGLMGIDERVLLDADYMTSLTEDSIYTELLNYGSTNIDNQGVYPGKEAGLITFSNARIKPVEFVPIFVSSRFDADAVVAGWGKPDVIPPRIRRLFSESWMFKDFKRTPTEGLNLTEIIPDTITSWAIIGFSLNPNTGFTLTKSATKLKVFQQFFISMDLPKLVKEGEIIEIPVYVFNYIDKDLLTDVTITNPSGELQILDNLNSESKVQHNQTFSKTIRMNEKEKFVFLVRPRKSGLYNVSVRAISSMASDAVEKVLTVASDGIPYSMSKTYLVYHSHASQGDEDEFLVEIPENIVPESESVQLTVVADIFGPLMRSLQNLVRVPIGNSENNIRYFVSNLLVLKYLKTIKRSSPSLRSKATLYLELGYQTQLTFRQLDGSFSLFDRTLARTGDTRVTAYTMWALQQAKNFIQVDLKVIDRGLSYLKSKQAENGGFSSEDDIEADVALTALSTLAFLVEEKSKNQYQDVINKSLIYLYDVLDDLEQSTAIAFATYALVLGKHEKSEELQAKLSTHAALKRKQLQWTNPDTLQSNLETTTYIFMSLLESQENSLQTLYPILQSLIAVVQAKITPAHMLALEAMIKFAHHIDVRTTNLSINFEDDQGESGGFQVNFSNAQVLQQVQLKGSSRRIKLRTKGKGFSLVGVNYKYNLFFENQSSDYQTNVTINELTDRTLILDVCVATQLLGSQRNLTIMDVNLQSGYTVYEYGFERIKENNERVKSIELKENNQSVRLYLENISQNGTCIQLEGTKIITVFNLKPISIIVYDVKNEHQRSVLYHKFNPQRNQN